MSYFIFSLVGGVLDRKGLFWISEFRQQHEIVNTPCYPTRRVHQGVWPFWTQILLSYMAKDW